MWKGVSEVLKQTRRNILRTLSASALIAGILTLYLIAGGAVFANKKELPPNLILVLTDDQGYGDIGVHGNDMIKTPYMDRLADESVELTQFYCSPVCAPTRASLMTGRYNYRTGVVHTSRGAAKMHADEVTIAEMLTEAGYKTGIFGKWHLGDNYPLRPSEQGFQESLIHSSGGIGQTPDIPNSYFDPKLWHNNEPKVYKGYCTDIFTDAAIQFIENNRDHHFFAYIAYNAPHSPLIIGKEYYEPYLAMGLPESVARIYGMITNIDDNLGRLFNTLKRLNIEDNTIFIFMSDNGPSRPQRYFANLRGLKTDTYDGGTRVPFYIKWPRNFKAGKKVDRIAAHIDFTPTVLDALGIEKPETVKFDGVSLMPLLQKDNVQWQDRTLYFQFNRGMVPRIYQNCSARSQRYKIVSAHGSSRERDSSLPDLEPDFELFDMSVDKYETNNISQEHPDIVERMRKGYEIWFKEMVTSRNIEPGMIYIGSEKSNPVHLSRYQDSSYIDGISQGWPVEILKSGRYKISINRIGYKNKARLFVEFRNYSANKILFTGENWAVFQLPYGSGMLKVWFEEDGKEKIVFASNDTIGDVDIEFLN